LTVLDEDSKNNLEEELKLIKDYIIDYSVETNEEDSSYLFIITVNNKLILDNILEEGISLIYDLCLNNSNFSKTYYDIDIGKIYAILTIYNN
jgi:hypothetical protein